jgi:pyridoxamine 5'-phosphate oxidase
MAPSDNVIPPTPSAEKYAEDESRDLAWLEVADPIKLFEDWLAKAGETEPNDSNAMSLATVDENGLPDVRIVLLKGLDERGFVFYTNGESAKGQQLGGGKAALCFHWKSQKRQVRVRGSVTPVSSEESDAYFAKRARGSRLGAWASDQSRPVLDRDTMIERVQEVKDRFEGRDIPRPPHWFGWRVVPESIEFWQDGAFRLHDRIVFTHSENEKAEEVWTKTRLYP